MRKQLEATVEALRAEEYPTLDAALVGEILKIESEHLNERGAIILTRLKQVIDASLREAKAQ